MQTSNGVAMMALADGDQVVFDTSKDENLIGSREYRKLLEIGLARLNANLRDITELFVDIGPGGLGVTRTAAAFTNGLGFALDLPVTGIPAFELLGAQVSATQVGTIVIMRKAAKPFVHFGVFENNTLTHYAHCTRSDAQEKIAQLGPVFYVGNTAPQDIEIPTTNATEMQIMLKVARQRPAPAPKARAYPIVEILQ
jgi:tRNA threonylcarbamoyladenosine biosynthesis protein TsaB